MSLVKDIEELQKHISVESSTEMDSVTPLIDEAEEQYIVPAIGITLYETLLQRVEDDDATADQEKLLTKILKALAPLSYFVGLAEANTRISDLGLHTASTNDKERLMKWQFDNLSISLNRRGMMALDRLYVYLETKTNADWYTTWTASDAYTAHKDLLVNTAVIFNRYVELQSNRWFFIQLRPWLRAAEKNMIAPAISIAFYDVIKTAWKNNTTSAEQKTAIAKMQECISYMAYSLALKDPGFIQELIIIKSSSREQVEAQRNSLSQYEQQSDLYLNLATNALNDLKIYLNATASNSVFAEYFGSDQYTNPTPVADEPTGIDRRTKNGESNTSFFF
jgi:hypothetical protein